MSETIGDDFKESDLDAKFAEVVRLNRAEELKQIRVGRNSIIATQKLLGKQLSNRSDQAEIAAKFMHREELAESLVNRGAKLNGLMANRMTKDRLAQMNIIKESAASSLASKATELKKAQTKDQLSNLILARQSKGELLQRNIIRDGGLSNKLAESQSALRKAQTKDKLASLLSNRVDVDSLVSNRILKSVEEDEAEENEKEETKSSLTSLLGRRKSISELVQSKVVADLSLLQAKPVDDKAVYAPTCVKSMPAKAVQVSAGWSHTLVLTCDGEVYSFGSGSNGKLGLGVGATQDVSTPTLVDSLKKAGKVSVISSGDNHSCALVDGQPFMWGAGGWGRLGLDGQADVFEPTPVLLGRYNQKKVAAVSCGSYHTLFLTTDGSVYSCGWHKNGRLGLGADVNAPVLIPTLVQGLPGAMVAVSAGETSSFAWDKDGNLYGWGHRGLVGGLIAEDKEERKEENIWEPVPIPLKVTAVSIGSVHGLALTTDGKLVAFGGNKDGQLGAPSDGGELVTVAIDGVTSISAGRAHSLCVAKGQVYAWGKGSKGVLGLGSENSVKTPVAVQTGDLKGAKAVDVRAMWTHSMAMTKDGGVIAFGSSSGGKLGL